MDGTHTVFNERCMGVFIPNRSRNVIESALKVGLRFIALALAFISTGLLAPSTYGQSSVCRDGPFTARGQASGTILNAQSARAIKNAALKRLNRNWKAIARKRCDAAYTKVKSGTCRCTFSTKSRASGTKLTVVCIGTGAACRVGQMIGKRVRC